MILKTFSCTVRQSFRQNEQSIVIINWILYDEIKEI